jgi:hypothetical protein
MFLLEKWYVEERYRYGTDGKVGIYDPPRKIPVPSRGMQKDQGAHCPTWKAKNAD